MFERYAVYYTPSGALAQAGAAWLGWDLNSGAPVAHPDITGLDLAELTQTPRKYGLHATIKPPFHLADGTTAARLRNALADFCAEMPAVELAGLEVSRLGRFLALTARGDTRTLSSLASNVVRHFDNFRAAPSAAELDRRRAQRLSPAQERNLSRWGYPHVMDQFRFHITLTGRRKDICDLEPFVAAHFAPALPTPFIIDSLTLAGQDKTGMFHAIERFALKHP